VTRKRACLVCGGWGYAWHEEIATPCVCRARIRRPVRVVRRATMPIACPESLSAAIEAAPGQVSLGTGGPVL
jgi:hypothetical protein